MELYIGGMSQGKLEFVCNKKKISKDSNLICDGADCSREEILSKQIINHFHVFLKRLLTDNLKNTPYFPRPDLSYGLDLNHGQDLSRVSDSSHRPDLSHVPDSSLPDIDPGYAIGSAKLAEEFTEKLIVQNPSAIIICNEVGYGIVPMDKADRIYRETVGRCLCRLAAHSTSVEKIICGLGMKIK